MRFQLCIKPTGLLVKDGTAKITKKRKRRRVLTLEFEPRSPAVPGVHFYGTGLKLLWRCMLNVTLQGPYFSSPENFTRNGV